MQVFSGSNQVELDVGGFNFTSTQRTLRNAPATSLFAAMFRAGQSFIADQVSRWTASGSNFVPDVPGCFVLLLAVALATTAQSAILQTHCCVERISRDGRHFHVILNYLRVSIWPLQHCWPAARKML